MTNEGFIEIARVNSTEANHTDMFLEYLLFNLVAIMIDFILSIPWSYIDLENIPIILMSVPMYGIDTFDNISYIIKDLKKELSMKDGRTYDRKKLQELRNKLDEIIKEYEKIFDNYSYLEPKLKEAGYTRKLKK